MTSTISAPMADLFVAMSPGALGMRYLTAAGLTLLLYDHALTMGDEIRLIWLKRPNAMKIIFLCVRYIMPATIILIAHVTSGFSRHSTDFCRGWIVVVGVSCFVWTTLANFVLIVRIYTLWDHRKNVLRALLYPCIVTSAISLAFGGLAMSEMIPDIQWEPVVFHTCMSTTPSKWLVGYWAPEVAFETYAFFLTLFNAVDRPRRAHSRLIADLNRDGVVYFFILFWIRVGNVILSAWPNASYNLLLAFFVWPVAILTLTRLLLRVEDMIERAKALESSHFDALELAPAKDGDGKGGPPKIAINTVSTTAIL